MYMRQGVDYYLYPTQSKTISVKKWYSLDEKLTLDYPADGYSPFKLDDRVFLLHLTEEAVLPYEWSVAALNRSTRTFVLRVSAAYQQALPLAALSLLLPTPGGYTKLSSQQVAAITSLMNIRPLDRPPVEPADADEPEMTKFQELTLASLDKLASSMQTVGEQLQASTRLMQQLEQEQSSFSTRSLDLLATSFQSSVARFNALADDVHTFLQERNAPTPLAVDADSPDGELAYAEDAAAAGEESDETEEIFEEAEVLDYVKDYIRRRGYYFEDEVLFNYHICLKTRPFVILAGLSGTGKSKLAQLYAEALGQEKAFKRLPVRPNWTDDRYLLGYFNTVTGEYVTEPAVEFLLAAIADQKRLYSLCLDEMNLAHVEYYFSQFLSAMEGDRPEERRIELLGQRAFERLREQQRGQRTRLKLPPAQIYLPDNLLFTGTINVDETTQPISDKVIDRANTIEFFNVNLDAIPARGNPGNALPISNRAWQSYRATQEDTSYRAQIVEMNKILGQADIGLGYRVVHEIELYLANSRGLLDPHVAFDLQCKQRILPRIRGTEVIENMLVELIAFCKKQRLDRTEKRLQEMRSRLKRDGYTSFWR